MKQLEVTYRPVSFLPWERTARGSHPENWEEVTERQLTAISALMTGVISEAAFLRAMTGFSHRVIKKLDEYQRYKITELLGFTRERNPHYSFIIRRIMASGLPFTAPNPKMKGMPFGQFVFADTLFGDYQENKTPENISRFMAALYIPAGEKFNEGMIEQNTPLMQKTKPEMQQAIVINYLLVKQWLMRTYPLIFVTNDDDTGNQNPETATGDPMAWVKIFENLVSDDIINEDKYAALPVHNVLRFMSKKVKENMKRKRGPS